MALAASVVIEGAAGFDEGRSRLALLAVVLTMNLTLMLVPPLISLLLLAGVIR